MVKSKKKGQSKQILKTRKDLRKEKRGKKKQNKRDFFSKPKNNEVGGNHKTSENRKKNDLIIKKDYDDDEINSDFELSDNEVNQKITKINALEMGKAKIKKVKSSNGPSETDRFLEIQKREKKKQTELEKKMRKKRIVQLKEANEEEDIIIRKLEKKLKISKDRNEKTVHKMFNDGLDYALELCLPDNINKMYTAAKEAAQLNEDSDDDFQEDLALALGKNIKTNNEKPKLISVKKQKKLKKVESKYFDELESNLSGTDSELDDEDGEKKFVSKSNNDYSKDSDGKDFDDELNSLDTNSLKSSHEDDSQNDEYLSDESDEPNNSINVHKKRKLDVKNCIDNDEKENSDIESAEEEETKLQYSEKNENVWEDIYGRKRNADGNIIEINNQKYLPPHMRTRLDPTSNNDPKRKEKLDRLKKQCKGYLNRLSEANMHKISTDIENLYMNNPRFDMNNTITQLILDALVDKALAKERMVLEHTMLIAILHGNVGSEVGAHLLENLILQFSTQVHLIDTLDIENKELDNILFILSHLYTFKIFQHSLIFEIINKVAEKICEKSVECLLLMLRTIGFQLRKDDPIALKNLLLSIQKKSNDEELKIKENPRFKFMLEIINAIKNNNMKKIPQYDPELAEHLKKILKSMFTNGKYITTLNITLEDLLKADEKGKWWVVGSAWTGNIKDIGAAKQENDNNKNVEKFSEKLLELAKKHRMNTNDRRNVFCIVMSAEDYVDAFERLLHLSLKDHRIISSVLIHCCLTEKLYNPYYSVLAQKFCDYDRKYQLAIQFSIWDRIKDISSTNKQQIKNLAQFLIFLITQGAQPISILKVIEFAELDKTTLRLLRQIFLGILLGKEAECQQVFERIAPSMKLNNFKDSIKLFMHHFLLKGTNAGDIQKDQLELLQERILLADRTLANADLKFRF